MESSVRVGGQLAAYRIERLVGRGGMAVVYLAQHVHLRRSVALKIPAEEFATRAGFRERFIRESRIAASIDHPNLVTIFDAGEADGVLFLAMQYVEGGDLKTVLQEEGRLEPVRACAYLVQIAAALDAAHERGLVHRDIKPGNVLVEREQCYVTDFGLSKPANASREFTQEGAFVGTLDYAAPEQISGRAVDRRVDIYALGCVAFEALTGSVPFERDSVGAILFAHLTAPPPSIRELGPELPAAGDHAIARALAKDANDRYDSAGEFVEALSVALGVRARTASSVVAATPAAPLPGPSRVRLPLPRPLETADSFVGREGELAGLRARWVEASAGASVGVALGGEAGIGKTRLASEFAGALHAEDALVLYGRCDEGLAVPYQPFSEALRPLARALGADRLRVELSGLAPELRRLFPELTELGEPVRADPESERYALFEAVAALLEAATREQPALLVLDDLHWAANPTVLLLRHVLRSERPLSALLLTTYRDTEVAAGQPLASLLADLYRGSGGRRLSVAGLEHHAIAELLEAAGCPVPYEDGIELLRALEAQTGGNPLYIRELLADLVESGKIEGIVARALAGRGAEGLEAPEGLRQIIGQRVARLSEPARRMLTVAAVAGPAFSFGLLEGALDADPWLLDALEEAVAAGLLTEAGPDEYTFTHALVRQTLYSELGSARRIRLHRQIAEAIEALGDPEEHAEALSHHFAQAAGGAKAADYALLAGRRAMARLGYEEAAGFFARGLEALRQPDAERRGELLLALGEARWGMGAADEAREACLQAAEEAERDGDAVRLARAALGFAGPLFFLAGGPVVGLIERALAALGEEDSALRARLLGRLAASFAPGADVRAREALEMARRVGDKAALGDVISITRLVNRGPDDLDERLEAATELARVADEIGDGQLRGFAYEWLLNHQLELGDIDSAEHELAALRRLGEARGDRYSRWLVALLDARHALLAGRLAEAEALAEEALAQGGGAAGIDAAPAQAYAAQIFFVRREQGRIEQVVESIEGVARAQPGMSVWRCTLAFAYAEAGRAAQAREELEAIAQAGFDAVPRDALWLLSMSELADVVSYLDDAPRAEPLYELLAPYADRCVVAVASACLGSAARPLGVLAAALGRHEQAAAHFEAALAMNTRIRSPLWVAHTQCDYARMLLARGDRDRALGLLEQALATGEALTLSALTRKARALLDA